MMNFRKAVMVVGILAVAGCTNADRFGGGTDFEDDGAFGADASAAGFGDPASPQYFSQAVGDRVLFAVDQYTLTPQAQATLDAQAAWLLSNPDYTATIEGHADEQGTREYNIGLSNRRAVAVQDYLVSKGVSNARLTTVGFGKERPISVCSNESCYSQNRRAVTILTGGVLG